MLIVVLIAIGFAVTALAFGVAYLRERGRSRSLRDRYSPIVDVEAAVARAREALSRLEAETRSATAEQHRQREELSREYAAAKATYDRLRREIAALEETFEDLSVGLYAPHYDFDSSEKYRLELDAVRTRQKDMLRAGRAAVASVEWSVGGSRREGERMQKQYLKLMLRAFNGECDAAVARVAWNNVLKMEERIRKAFEAINALGGVMQMEITGGYLQLKLAELRLEHEYEEKRRAELEEQRRIREQMREEERALREAERARQEAEAEEARNQKALEKARAELAKAEGAALEQLKERIVHLDAALQRARELKDRATTMAQLTRSGHVYVISNVGSFGENVYKIGMTRRLDPLERVRELGDSSVPFEFDVHAMIYSEDAPALENLFHCAFAEQRVNLVNLRREFFAVSIEDIARVATVNGLVLQLTKLAEARDYRATLAKRAGTVAEAAPAPEVVEFPSAL